MDPDFTKTEYFQYLLKNSDLLDKQRIEFNDKIIELLNSQIDDLGMVLKCHLIIEHYIDEYIYVAYPTITKFDKIRLTFNQKLEMINNDRTFIGMSYLAIKSLNNLRNKFSHKLAYKIVESDYTDIKEFMTIWSKAFGEETPSDMQLIQKFTVWICANINSITNGIKLETPELGLPGYLEWLKKKNSINSNSTTSG